MDESQHSFFEDSRKILEQYVQDRILLLKLQAAEKSARLSALLFSGLIISLLCFFILMFLSLMTGFYFATITGNLYIGFAIVTFFYVIILGLVILKRAWFSKTIINAVISIFFDKNESKHE